MTTRDTYIKTMKANLDKLNDNMNDLEAKAKVARKDAQERYELEMGKLQHQSKLALAKLDEMKAAGADTWDSMVTEMEKVRDAFVHSFSYFKSQL